MRGDHTTVGALNVTFVIEEEKCCKRERQEYEIMSEREGDVGRQPSQIKQLQTISINGNLWVHGARL